MGRARRCCMPQMSFTQEFLVMTVRACSRYLRTESSRSCQTSKARSSPSTWSFRSMLLSYGEDKAECLDVAVTSQHIPCGAPLAQVGANLHHVPEHIAEAVCA